MSRHVQYFSNSSTSLQTADGQDVKIINLMYSSNRSILSEWATHLRNHYCPDSEIDQMCQGTGLTRSEYLRDIKLPSLPHIRSADFAEIMVADYIQYVLGYQVPRTRYEAKINRNSSPMGIDILAFKIISQERDSNDDELLTCEVKAALQSQNRTTLAKALADSKKDFNVRKGESLNAMKQRLRDKSKYAEANLVERYQDKTDRPYREISGAAAVHSDHTWDISVVTTVSCSDHPNRSALLLLTIKGERLMDLANGLYRRACDET